MQSFILYILDESYQLLAYFKLISLLTPIVPFHASLSNKMLGSYKQNFILGVLFICHESLASCC